MMGSGFGVGTWMVHGMHVPALIGMLGPAPAGRMGEIKFKDWDWMKFRKNSQQQRHGPAPHMLIDACQRVTTCLSSPIFRLCRAHISFPSAISIRIAR
jgi:hypothetical protein